MTTDNYNKISTGLDIYESLIKKIELENNNCENVDIILNSQIVGVTEEKIDRNIKTKQLNEEEKTDLLDRFSDLKDYFADVQVNFEMNCICRTTTEEEKEKIYQRHEQKVTKEKGIDYLKSAYTTAALQLIEEESKKRNK